MTDSQAIGSSMGSRVAESRPVAVDSLGASGARPPANVADSTSAATVLVPAAIADAAARVLRRAVATGRYQRHHVISQVAGTLEAAAVAPQEPAAYVIRTAGKPDTVAIPVEIAGQVARALDAGFLEVSRVDRCPPPRDLTQLRDRLRRAPLIEDLRGSESGTTGAGRAHTAPVDYLTVTQYAERRGCTPTYVRRLCREGQIPGAYRAGSTWMIPSVAPLTGTRTP